MIISGSQYVAGGLSVVEHEKGCSWWMDMCSARVRAGMLGTGMRLRGVGGEAVGELG